MGRLLHVLIAQYTSFTRKLIFCLLCLALPASALAVPSVFPEDAGFVNLGLGYGNGLKVGLGVEFVVPVRYLDVSVQLEAYTPLAGVSEAGFRVSGTALLLPALGTTPPLAVGLGADTGYGPNGVNLHTGPLVGTDLLFSLRLPMIASLYLAPGFASQKGFSLAWAAQIRYYFDAENVAVELSSTDLALLGLGVRVLF